MACLDGRWALHRSFRPEEGPQPFAVGERAVAKRVGLCAVSAIHGGEADVVPSRPGAAVQDAARVPLSTLVRVHEHGHVVCAETSDFRVLAATQLRADDMVVEIGASYGRATAILAKHCRRVVGIDTSVETVRAARAQYPRLEFAQFDVIEQTHLLAELTATDACTVSFVDLGGNRELGALQRVLPIVRRVLKPRLVCIKSRELYAALEAHARAHGGLTSGGVVPAPREWWAACAADGALQLPAKAAKRYHNQGCELQGGSQFTRYPLSYVPAACPDGRKICRFHNYGVCTRGAGCAYDHEHCHRCLAAGHKAKNCPRSHEPPPVEAAGAEECAEPASRRQRLGDEPCAAAVDGAPPFAAPSSPLSGAPPS